MFGKIMSVKDELVNKYFNLCTRVPLEEIPEILKLHPKEAKLRLAFEITSLYNGPKAAQRAKDEWENTFSKGETPADIPETTVSGETTFLEALGVLDESKTTLRRLAEQGAISDEHGKKVGDLSKAVHHSVTLRIGKHRFLKIVVK
jgi:tyrosyl-tRNA synthetase